MDEPPLLIPQRTILFLAANPIDSDRLALDREAKNIRQTLERSPSPYRGRFVLETRGAVEPGDLLRELVNLKPTVVHFAGHGHGRDVARLESSARDGWERDVAAAPGAHGNEQQHGLIFEGPHGLAQFVGAEALQLAFETARDSVKLVILNACYSEPVAEVLLSAGTDFVVGMSGSVEDSDARAFATGFYVGLAGGQSVDGAYRAGLASSKLEGLRGEARPQLKCRQGCDPTAVVLAGSPSAVIAPERIVGGEPARRTLVEIAKQFIRTVVERVRVIAGAMGVGAGCVMLVAVAMLAWRLEFGASGLDVRVQRLAVRAGSPPEPVQGNAEVRKLVAAASKVVDVVGMAAPNADSRITLTGAFLSIELGRPAGVDPECRLILRAHARGVDVERATPDGAGCSHDVTVVAGSQGLDLRIDDGSATKIKGRLILRTKPGSAITLVPRDNQLAFFRSTDHASWSATRLEGSAAAGELIRLPGTPGSSETFQLEGAVKLEQLVLYNERLAVIGSLRHWSGILGRAENWNSAAPWPRALYCWIAAGLISIVVFLHTRRRIRTRSQASEVA